MTCKKCDCAFRLHFQDIKHRSEMDALINQFIRLKRDMAWFKYTVDGNIDHIKKCEYELKNGGI